MDNDGDGARKFEIYAFNGVLQFSGSVAYNNNVMVNGKCVKRKCLSLCKAKRGAMGLIKAIEKL